MKTTITMLLLLGTSLLASGNCLAQDDMDDFAAAYHRKLALIEADELPLHQNQRNIIVGIQTLSEEQQEQLLGNEADDTYAVHVIISNNSRYRLLVNGRDAALTQGNNILKPANLAAIIEAIDPPSASTGKAIANTTLGILTMGVHTLLTHTMEGDADLQVRTSYLISNIHEKHLQQKILEPGQSYQGLLFFDQEKKEDMGANTFQLTVQNLNRVAYLTYELPMN